jgi:hypothetical protein
MKDEIIEELWNSKDKIAANYDYNINKLIRKLKENEKKGDAPIMDFSDSIKKASKSGA